MDKQIFKKSKEELIQYLAFKRKHHIVNNKKGKDITKNECNNIISSSKEILTNAIIDGGTTIKSYTSSLGVTGHYQDKLYVHKRDNMNCKICNSLILKDRIGGRSTYYCPNCQK